MAPTYKASFGFLALLPLLSSIASAELDPADAPLSISSNGNNCIHLNNTDFNVTGSADTGNNNAFQGKWRMGLTATSGPKANVAQAFWIDTTGHDELNATQLQNGCLRIYDNIQRADWGKASNDNGDCNALLGSDCVQALYSAIPSLNGPEPQTACNDLNFEMPKECTILQDAGSNSRASSTFWGPHEGDNGTCSTQNNEKGDKTAFMTLFSQDWDYADNANYDAMAQRPYVLINLNSIETTLTDGSNMTQTDYKMDIVCMRNKDFAKDARVPDAMKLQETPTAGAPAPTGSDKPGAASTLSASGLGVMGALAAMMFLF